MDLLERSRVFSPPHATGAVDTRAGADSTACVAISSAMGHALGP